jgi:hypothetical protein
MTADATPLESPPEPIYHQSPARPVSERLACFMFLLSDSIWPLIRTVSLMFAPWSGCRSAQMTKRHFAGRIHQPSRVMRPVVP